MAETEKGNEIPEIFKPLFDRASQAEERLSRLEAALASKKDSGNEEHSNLVGELQSKLEAANADLLSERKKTQTLVSENAKLQYRIKHLIGAFKEALPSDSVKDTWG